MHENLDPTSLSEPQRREAVATFNSRYGEMERVLWCLSKYCREPLLEGQSSPVVEALVWTIKSWWGVQGVRSETKAQMSEALAMVAWSPDLFNQQGLSADGAEAYAYDLVASVVETSMSLGTPRREFSLASKALHWLLPWRIPVYDSFVRDALDIPKSWDHPRAYRKIVRDVFALSHEFTATDSSWVGEIEPRSPLRAFDKCLWWLGGGSIGAAAEVNHPWRVVHRLGLEPC